MNIKRLLFLLLLFSVPAMAQNPPGGYGPSIGGPGGGAISPGTVNALSCYTSANGIGPCLSGATDNGTTVNIPKNVTMGGGGGAGSFNMPLGLTSACLAPTAGFGALCGDATNNTMDLSIGTGAYVPLSTTTTGSGAPVGSCTATQFYVNTANGNTYSCSGGSWVLITGSNIALSTGGVANGSQTALNLAGSTNVTITDNGSGTDTFALTGLVAAPNTIAAVSGKKLDSYNQSTGNFGQSRYGIAAPIFSTTDTLSDTVTGQQLFATNMTIPANTLVTNVGYKFMVALEWTTVVTVPSYTFEILLCPTQGSLTGCKDVYKSTTTQPIATAGTFSSAMEFGFVGETAAGATATVMMLPAGGVGANSPVGRNTVALSQGNIPTNANLFLQFPISFSSAAGAGTNTLSVRSLISEPSPIL
jgi:hypothetical protein